MATLPTNSPAYCRPAAFDAFQSALSEVDTTAGLFQAAVAISLHEWPDEKIDDSLATIDGLASAVRKRVHSDAPKAVLAHLHDVLFDLVGFQGNNDDYYNPANSYVGRVLSSHRGIPISLVLIYKMVSHELGITVHGINSPGHFLAGVEASSAISSSGNKVQLMYVDPFYGGGLLTEAEVFQRIVAATGEALLPVPGMLAIASHRQWLARMLHNLQAVFARQGRERDQLAMQELGQLLGRS